MPITVTEKIIDAIERYGCKFKASRTKNLMTLKVAEAMPSKENQR